MKTRIVELVPDLGNVDIGQLTELFSRVRYRHFFQAPEFIPLLAAQGAYDLAVTAENGSYRAASIIRKQRVSFVPLVKLFIDRGPVFDDAEWLEPHLRAIVGHYGSRMLCCDVYPYLSLAQDGESPKPIADRLTRIDFAKKRAEFCNYTARVSVDLRPTLDEIMMAFRQSTRQRVRQAVKSSLECRVVGSRAEYDRFVAASDRFSITKGIGRLGGIFRGDFYQNCLHRHPVNRVFMTMQGEEPLAGILTIGCGDRLFYVSGFSGLDEKSRKISQTHLLHWNAIRHAKGLGLAYYDLGGYWLDRGRADPINQYKTGFGGAVAELIGEYRYDGRSWSAVGVRRLRRLRRRLSRGD